MQGTMIDDSHITELPAHAGFITFESLLDKINPSDQESTIDVAPLFTGAKTLRQGESVQAQFFVIDRYQPEHYDVNTTDWGTGAHMAAQSGGTMLLAWIKAKGSIYTLFGVYLAGRHVQGRMTDHVRLFEGMVKTGSKSNLYTSIQDVLKVRLQLIRSNKAPPGLQFLPLACWFEWEPSSRYEKRGSKPLPPKASTESDGLPESVSGAYTAAETMSKSGEGESSVSENRTWDAGTEGSCLPWSSWFTGDWWPCFAPGTAER